MSQEATADDFLAGECSVTAGIARVLGVVCPAPAERPESTPSSFDGRPFGPAQDEGYSAVSSLALMVSSTRRVRRSNYGGVPKKYPAPLSALTSLVRPMGVNRGDTP